MRKLKINWRDFEVVADWSDDAFANYLDLETGAVISVSRETRDELEQLKDEADEDASIDEILAEAPHADWEKQALRDAWQIEESLGSRILALEDADLRATVRDLEEFTATVQDAAVRAKLKEATRGRGAFRRFRDVIEGTFRERKQWFAFREQRQRERATDWLADQGIKVEWVLPEPLPAELEPPPARDHLLEGVLKFVRSARAMPGVRRIALLGSLTRAEPDPKDADVLVTVSDDMDLTPLAKAGRQLAGHAQQQGRGGDAFLANEAGRYIGRICPWRECGPFIRVSCDAAHCGRRHYLHDDFEAVRLDSMLVAEPPIELWPRIYARVKVPADVQKLLIDPLHADAGHGAERQANPAESI